MLCVADFLLRLKAAFLRQDSTAMLELGHSNADALLSSSIAARILRNLVTSNVSTPALSHAVSRNRCFTSNAGKPLAIPWDPISPGNSRNSSLATPTRMPRLSMPGHIQRGHPDMAAASDPSSTWKTYRILSCRLLHSKTPFYQAIALIRVTPPVNSASRCLFTESGRKSWGLPAATAQFGTHLGSGGRCSNSGSRCSRPSNVL